MTPSLVPGAGVEWRAQAFACAQAPVLPGRTGEGQRTTTLTERVEMIPWLTGACTSCWYLWRERDDLTIALFGQERIAY